MTVIKDECVDCGLPCYGKTCPNKNATYHYCDDCKTAHADYFLNGEAYCTDCAQNYLMEMFKDMTIIEKAATLGVAYEVI